MKVRKSEELIERLHLFYYLCGLLQKAKMYLLFSKLVRIVWYITILVHYSEYNKIHGFKSSLTDFFHLPPTTKLINGLDFLFLKMCIINYTLYYPQNLVSEFLIIFCKTCYKRFMKQVIRKSHLKRSKIVILKIKKVPLEIMGCKKKMS